MVSKNNQADSERFRFSSKQKDAILKAIDRPADDPLARIFLLNLQHEVHCFKAGIAVARTTNLKKAKKGRPLKVVRYAFAGRVAALFEGTLGKYPKKSRKGPLVRVLEICFEAAGEVILVDLFHTLANAMDSRKKQINRARKLLTREERSWFDKGVRAEREKARRNKIS